MKFARAVRRLGALVLLGGMTTLLSGCMDQLIVLNPKGEIGQQQLDLIVITTLLCLVIIVPVLVMAFVFAYRYRDRKGSTRPYKPNWDENHKLEFVWWGIPILIIVILATITVRASHKLEPSKPLESEAKPLVIQVASLDWKWLFLYPEQGIATVNYVEFPEDVPVQFQLTSDAPMNSFWIPQLGGQIYTMSGMAMKLHLIADEPGTYLGSAANFSGKDFAKMLFDAKAVTQADFDHWLAQLKATAPKLTDEGYAKLAEPGTMGTQDYSAIPDGLFDRIVNKYVVPGSEGGHHHGAAAEPSASPSAEEAQASAEPSATHQHH